MRYAPFNMWLKCCPPIPLNSDIMYGRSQFASIIVRLVLALSYTDNHYYDKNKLHSD